jgi:hypothetical protein
MGFQADQIDDEIAASSLRRIKSHSESRCADLPKPAPDCAALTPRPDSWLPWLALDGHEQTDS